jgi:hypothetical protein
MWCLVIFIVGGDGFCGLGLRSRIGGFGVGFGLLMMSGIVGVGMRGWVVWVGSRFGRCWGGCVGDSSLVQARYSFICSYTSYLFYNNRKKLIITTQKPNKNNTLWFL